MASFAGVTFRLLVQGHSLPQEAEVTERHIPGGDASYVDRAGRKLPRIAGQVMLDSLADFTSLRGQLGAADTLAYSEGSFDAVLLRLRRTSALPGGKQFADAEWLLTAS